MYDVSFCPQKGGGDLKRTISSPQPQRVGLIITVRYHGTVGPKTSFYKAPLTRLSVLGHHPRLKTEEGEGNIRSQWFNSIPIVKRTNTAPVRHKYAVYFFEILNLFKYARPTIIYITIYPTSESTTIINAFYSDIPLYDDGNFDEVYVASIATPLRMVEHQFKQLHWNESPLEVHQPVTHEEVSLLVTRESLKTPF